MAVLCAAVLLCAGQGIGRVSAQGFLAQGFLARRCFLVQRFFAQSLLARASLAARFAGLGFGLNVAGLGVKAISPSLKAVGPSLKAVGPSLKAVGLNKRSEERRVGKECVSTCRSRWSQYH